MNSHIFISYASEDRDTVLQFTAALETAGYRVWVDQRGLRPGTFDWEQDIREAIEGADSVVLAASPASRKSRYVKDELRLAEHYVKPVYPVWIGGSDWIDCVPMGWGGAQFVDVRTRDFTAAIAELRQILGSVPTSNTTAMPPPRRNVFLTYRHSSEPDISLALHIETALKARGYRVYADDQGVVLGTRGAERTLEEIARSDAVILLLSEASIHNQVLNAQLNHINTVRGDHPLDILPVRVRLRVPFPYHLQPVLDSVAWTFWNDDSDTPRLVNELVKALEGGTLSLNTSGLKKRLLQSAGRDQFQPPQPYADPRRVVAELGRFYKERPSDSGFVGALRTKAATVVVKAPSQMGKTSLLVRGVQTAHDMGLRVGFIDFSASDLDHLMDETALFQWFTVRIAESLRLSDLPSVTEVWEDDISGAFQCTDYLEGYVLPMLKGQPFLLALDDVDRLFPSDYRSDFFGMLRNWHNNRSFEPDWVAFNLAMAISTEPYLLIENLNQSPFNVGTVLILQDFDREQTAQLNEAYGKALTPDQLDTLYDLLNGHPYLTREALYRLATGSLSLERMLKVATEHEGPFGDHLMHYLLLLSTDPALLAAMRDAVLGHELTDKMLISRLQSTGLVQPFEGGVRVRCRLYDEYFKRRLRV